MRAQDHDYNWFGPGSSGYPSEPTDGNGHGTHVTGTMAGQPVSVGIGMAPAAEWVAAAGCNPFGSCPTLDLTMALQWSGCPTRTCDPDDPECLSNPDCTRAPDIVGNSWGGGQGSSAFWDVLGVLKEEEIIVTFAMGNSGGTCGTANSPGDSDLVIGVGASDSCVRLSCLDFLLALMLDFVVVFVMRLADGFVVRVQAIGARVVLLPRPWRRHPRCRPPAALH